MIYLYEVKYVNLNIFPNCKDVTKLKFKEKEVDQRFTGLIKF
jgi:hypothetical protein